MSKKVIIIGASSGIGRALAKEFARNGYTVGITGRRTTLLDELKKELPGNSFVQTMDVSSPVMAMEIMEELLEKMGGADIVVINAGIGHMNPELDWSKEKETIDINVTGFAAIANVAMKHFLQKDRGHLVGISSIAGIRGSSYAPAYAASKAFMSNYLEGLRFKQCKGKSRIIVTDVQPGFVDTVMAQGDGIFWVSPAEKAAQQIFKAIQKKRAKVYVTKRWLIIAWLLRIMPGWVVGKM